MTTNDRMVELIYAFKCLGLTHTSLTKRSKGIEFEITDFFNENILNCGEAAIDMASGYVNEMNERIYPATAQSILDAIPWNNDNTSLTPGIDSIKVSFTD